MPEIPHGALAVICDGGKAVLPRNIGTETSLVLQEARRVAFEDVENDGPSGMRPKDQMRRQTEEASFAKQLVKLLSGMLENGLFSALVLAADPQTPGQMRDAIHKNRENRDAMHKNLERSILFSLAKDLTNTPPAEMARMLAATGAAPAISQ